MKQGEGRKTEHSRSVGCKHSTAIAWVGEGGAQLERAQDEAEHS